MNHAVKNGADVACTLGIRSHYIMAARVREERAATGRDVREDVGAAG